MTAEIIQFIPRPNPERDLKEDHRLLAYNYLRTQPVGPILCEDYCGHTPCECYPDSISFAKPGEPKVPA